MCGFAGVFSTDRLPAQEQTLRNMASCMARRGPDDDGYLVEGAIGLAFRRLSILDLSSAGHQPFTSSSGDLTIVFNGEIFNYRELRHELLAKGYQFRSGSDTEVLLASYAEWGTECLPRLNGMWAFLIYDRKRQLLFGARDRFGVKPLYRSRSGSTHYFASEIKALHIADRQTLEINWPLASRFLEEGRLDAMSLNHETFYSRVREVPQAHGFTIDASGQERTWRYWSLPSEDEVLDGDPTAQFLDLFEDSVRLRLRSDVPVGVALSGGMDSSSIIAMMAKMVGSADGTAMHGLHAFSYMPKEFDEERYIADSIELTGATLHRTNSTPSELWETLGTVLDAHDEPLHSPTALAGYQVYRLAATAGVRVVLGGQGADEVLGGYPSYFSEAWLDLLRSGRMLHGIGEIGRFAALHGESRTALLRALSIRFLATALPRPRARRRKPGEYALLLTSEGRELSEQFRTGASVLGLRNVLTLSLERHPLPLFLRIEDRNSMAHSVEARLPFLDYRLVSFAFRLENSWKIRGPWNKYVLRNAMAGIVPESVRTRVDKMGFPTGFSTWIRGPLRGEIESVLQDDRLKRAGVIDVVQLRRLFAEHLSGAQDHGLAIFHALQFAEWHGLTSARATRM